MKIARLNFTTSNDCPGTDDLPAFYMWLKKELEKCDFKFREGVVEGWPDLCELSVNPLIKHLEYPFFIFQQGEDCDCT